MKTNFRLEGMKSETERRKLEEASEKWKYRCGLEEVTKAKTRWNSPAKI